jgi:hypothetical protein
MAETGAGTSGNETAAAAADVPTMNSKPAGPTRKTKLVQVPEACILYLMWQKACTPRGDFPAWKPRPNDISVELIRSYEKAAAIIYKRHQHDDDLISQYINNGCAYVEVEIGDDE